MPRYERPYKRQQEREGKRRKSANSGKLGEARTSTQAVLSLEPHELRRRARGLPSPSASRSIPECEAPFCQEQRGLRPPHPDAV